MNTCKTSGTDEDSALDQTGESVVKICKEGKGQGQDNRESKVEKVSSTRELCPVSKATDGSRKMKTEHSSDLDSATWETLVNLTTAIFDFGWRCWENRTESGDVF